MRETNDAAHSENKQQDGPFKSLSVGNVGGGRTYATVTRRELVDSE